MSKVRFTKMHGIGNDYIYIDSFGKEPEDPARLAQKMSPRRTSVGSDGVILIGSSGIADAKMRIFNADGSEGKMCGNGIRCVGKYLFDRGIVAKPELTVETKSGVKTLWLNVQNGKVKTVKVDMGAPVLRPAAIPFIHEGEAAVKAPLTVGGKSYAVTAVSMGNPHAVVFCPDIEPLDLQAIGPGFEAHPAFPEGVNTEFVTVLDSRTLRMRVWERGSGETFACGTGACAAAVAAVLCGYCRKGEEITVRLKGGDLVIVWQEDGRVTMEGAAETVYEGEYEYESEDCDQ